MNDRQSGDPAEDTSKFDTRYYGNLRPDYVLPKLGIRILGCGVLWPSPGAPGSEWIDAADHRLAWLGVSW